MIGHAVYGESGFEAMETGLRSKACPEFTGNAGPDEGLEIGPGIRGPGVIEVNIPPAHQAAPPSLRRSR